jgi:hypothetical protein
VDGRFDVCGAGRFDVCGADWPDVCGDGRVDCGAVMRVVEVEPDVVADCRVDGRSAVDGRSVVEGRAAVDGRSTVASPVSGACAERSRAVLARGAPEAWPSTVAVRAIRAALVRPSTDTISGRPPRRGLGTQTLS